MEGPAAHQDAKKAIAEAVQKYGQAHIDKIIEEATREHHEAMRKGNIGPSAIWLTYCKLVEKGLVAP